MGSVLLSVAVALLAQFLWLPMLIGARRGGEAIGWTLILAIFFAAPSAAVYFLVFGLLKVAAVPALATIVLGGLGPAAAAAAAFWSKDRAKVFSRENYVVRMLLIGGSAGGLVLSGLLRVTHP